jgi:hypothetical protein
MTEGEWLFCVDPAPMLRFVGGRVSERKLRLFACACCRRLWSLLADGRSRAAVEAAERYADGECSDERLFRAAAAAEEVEGAAASAALRAHEAYLLYMEDVLGDSGGDEGPDDDGYHAFEAYVAAEEARAAAAAAVAAAAAWDVRRIAANAHPYSRRTITWNCCRIAGPPKQAELAAQSRLLRDVCNPFRRTDADPKWLRWNNGALPKMARAVYDGRRFADLPVLADALEDAGCTDAAVLGHCRGGGEHVRGCWVIDLLLGKA